MHANMPAAGPNEKETDSTRLREHAESTLEAIAGAIAVGRLPPDDAFAWARIAVYEITILVGRTEPNAINTDGRNVGFDMEHHRRQSVSENSGSLP